MLLPFGTFCGHLVHFVPFWYFVPRKIWQPCSEVERAQQQKKVCPPKSDIYFETNYLFGDCRWQSLIFLPSLDKQPKVKPAWEPKKSLKLELEFARLKKACKMRLFCD
jgi:hypothetical protein